MQFPGHTDIFHAVEVSVWKSNASLCLLLCLLLIFFIFFFYFFFNKIKYLLYIWIIFCLFNMQMCLYFAYNFILTSPNNFGFIKETTFRAWKQHDFLFFWEASRENCLKLKKIVPEYCFLYRITWKKAPCGNIQR